LEWPTPRKLFLECLRGYFQSVSADLRYSPMGDCATPEEGGDADDSVISRESHFGCGTVAHCVETRHDAGGWKVSIIDSFIALIYHFAKRKGYVS
jgi:hypothetical protein